MKGITAEEYKGGVILKGKCEDFLNAKLCRVCECYIDEGKCTNNNCWNLVQSKILKGNKPKRRRK